MDAFSRRRHPVSAPVDEERRARHGGLPAPTVLTQSVQVRIPVGSAEGHHLSRGCVRGKELLRMAWEATGEGAHMTPRRRYASVNGLEICYFEIHGAGNPLVLPQGAFGTI
jgi:hypothetical protein